jgi:hypothetical protein
MLGLAVGDNKNVEGAVRWYLWMGFIRPGAQSPMVPAHLGTFLCSKNGHDSLIAPKVSLFNVVLLSSCPHLL